MLVHMTLPLDTWATAKLGDGAMGTMIQARGLPDEAFGRYPGCNDALNLTRPEVISAIHDAYLAAGADWIETNTFGANLTALGDYGLEARLAEINLAGALLARRSADAASTPGWPRYVVGSLGPGSKLASLRQASFASLRDGYQAAAAALLAGGVDVLQVETCQDPLQAKAAIIGARRAMAAAGASVPIVACVTIETNGTMLLGTTVEAAVATLAHLGIDALGLNCATGPDLMEEPLRRLARVCPLPVAAMPNAGLPQLVGGQLEYQLSPDAFAAAVTHWVSDLGVAWVAGCCGSTPEHIAAARQALGRTTPVPPRPVAAVHALSSLYDSVEVRQDVSYLAIGERANVAGSKAFREAVAAGRFDEAIEVAKSQSRHGVHVLDLCVDRTDGDPVADMVELAARLASAARQPVMLDSSKPAVLVAGLEQLPGRSVVNSVNLEGGDGPGSKYEQVMQAVAEHGAAVVALTIDEAGMAVTRDRKVAVANRLINDLTSRWGLAEEDIFVDMLAYPVTTGFAETRAAAAETIEAIRDLKTQRPGVGTVLGISNVSFGLKPGARVLLNSVFLDECRQAGLDAAIVDAGKIAPLHHWPPAHIQAARDLVWDDHRRSDDPLATFLALFDEAGESSLADADELAALPLPDRLVRRIVDALPVGLEADLDAALASKDAISVVNDDLLEGMRVVGELFGQGQMQLPFVLASAEVMKKAVAYLEPALKASQAGGGERGILVLATVAGDVHDIGKNLVDIIVSNNGFKVINLGVRVPIDDIAAAALQHDATAIGLSGLLVRSAEVMRDNLAELTRRGLQRLPVVLGGAALSRAYVDSLRPDYANVYYGADAFDGLAVMRSLTDPAAPASPVVPAQGAPAGQVPPTSPVTRTAKAAADPVAPRSNVARREPVPQPPFWGAKQVAGITLDAVVPFLDEKALLTGQWGLRVPPGETFADLARQQRPRLDAHLASVRRQRLDQFRVAYGYWPAFSDGDELVLLDPLDQTAEIGRWRFPRQRRGSHLCLADYFRDAAEAAELGPDVVALHLVTMGSAATPAATQLFEAGHYRDYLELHGLCVQLAEALAQMWHGRIRSELGISPGQGQRFSFGYPACPDLAPRQLLYDLVGGQAIGVSLSETLQLVPEQSTDALIVHHRQARYFSAR